MSEYTAALAAKGHTISPEDDHYIEELIEVAETFRTFDAALDEFLPQNGYCGSLTDTDGKIQFLLQKFEAAGIRLDARTPKSWFCRHTRSTSREMAFSFCFAFQLSLAQAQDFFRCVYLQRGLDCHNPREAVYYYCICHGLSYADAQQLVRQLPDETPGKVDFAGEVLYTDAILQELDRFSSPDALLRYLRENAAQFRYNNATAYRYLGILWHKIADPNGLAAQEAQLLFPDRVSGKEQRSVWDVYLQIFGLLDYEINHATQRHEGRLFALKGDRSLRPLLQNSRLLPPIARDAFPDRQGLEGILRGEHQAAETVRKTMILLAFYQFWAERTVKCRTALYTAAPEEAQRCLSSVNQLLLNAGYPALYAGNPYGWLILLSAQDDDPLEAFRFFMRELYLNQARTD